MKKRRYRLGRRAEQQLRTRERIVDAAMALHEEVGPAETTISALAERAGVQRLTVYRHFPEERDILQACSSKWFALNQPPDVAKIGGGKPLERTRSVLAALYGYYERTRDMWTSLYRDLGKLPALDEPMAQFEAYLGSVRNDLLATWKPRRSRRLRATLGHALRFSTWQSLSAEGLSPTAMANLTTDWIVAAAGKA
jgi:AcrR family transcriptional regulator